MVDTNTTEWNGELLSIVAILSFFPGQPPDPDGARVVPAFCDRFLELRNVVGPAERVGWMMVIESLLADPTIRDAARVAIVVDAHLSCIADINARTEPVHGSLYLPPNFEFVYATDASADVVVNKLIRKADELARDVRKVIMETDPMRELKVATDRPFSHHRQWTPPDALSLPVHWEPVLLKRGPSGGTVDTSCRR